MCKYSFLYAAVAFIVLLSYTEVSTLTEYAIAQEQSSNQTQIIVAQTPEEKANLKRFDKLDFEAWNNRNWTLFREIHAPDVLVVDFNGNTTRGIEQHVQWAMAAISSSPDSRILAHPIKIAAGNWTAATGILPGNVTMVTVAHWKMAESPRSTYSCRIQL
jgi:Flp pilus assembly protein CpaB